MLEDPETYRNIIQTRSKKAESRGYSRKRITYELRMQYPNAHSLIDEIVSTYDDIEILKHIVLPHLLRTHPKEKVIQKCMQTGFVLRDIRSALVAICD